MNEASDVLDVNLSPETNSNVTGESSSSNSNDTTIPNTNGGDNGVPSSSNANDIVPSSSNGNISQATNPGPSISNQDTESTDYSSDDSNTSTAAVIGCGRVRVHVTNDRLLWTRSPHSSPPPPYEQSEEIDLVLQEVDSQESPASPSVVQPSAPPTPEQPPMVRASRRMRANARDNVEEEPQQEPQQERQQDPEREPINRPDRPQRRPLDYPQPDHQGANIPPLYNRLGDILEAHRNANAFQPVQRADNGDGNDREARYRARINQLIDDHMCK